MKKHYKSFLHSIFFPIYFLFIVANIPLNASSNIKEESDAEKKSQASRPESQLSLAVKSIIEDSSKEIASVSNSLVTIQQNISTALSKQSTDILGADKVLRQNISISKEKISTATSRLEQVNQAPTLSLTKSSSLGKITTLESLDAFLAKKGVNVSWGHNAGNIQSLIHSKHTSSPSWDVSYSGYAPFSGSASYTHYLDNAVWDCRFCSDGTGNLWYSIGNSNNRDQYIRDAYYCRSCGKYKDSGTRPVKVPLSGSTSYSGSQYYSGSTKTNCNQNHHDCQCADWAEIVLSFRETLQEKDFYKRAYEQQKAQVDLSKKAYEDIRGIKTNLDTAEEKGNQALMALQNERSAFQSQAEKITATVAIASQLVSDREAFKNKVIELVSRSEEEQRIEKEELKSKLTQREKILEDKNNSFIEEHKEQSKLAREDIQKKDDVIQKGHEKVEILLKEKLSDADRMGQEKINSLKEIGAIKESLKDEVSNLQAIIKAQEAKIRSTVPMIFLKLCTKAEIKGDKRKNYLGALKNKELSIIDLLEKAEEFLADDDFE
jgi:hypothetical protein